MKIELCLNRSQDLNFILNSKIYYKIDSIALHSSQISTFPDKNKHKSVLIDYPYGLGNTSVREHEVLYSIRAGANLIDLTLNPNLITNEDFNAIITEISVLKMVCKDKNIDIRPIIEYRELTSVYTIELCKRLYMSGINTIIVGTGSIIDDLTDNLVICQQIIHKTGLSAIPCSNFHSSKELTSFTNIGVKSIRTTSIKGIENIFK